MPSVKLRRPFTDRDPRIPATRADSFRIGSTSRHPVSDQCLANVCDVGPASIRHRAAVPCLPGLVFGDKDTGSPGSTTDACTAVSSQKAVTAYSSSKQLLSFLAWQPYTVQTALFLIFYLYCPLIRPPPPQP